MFKKKKTVEVEENYQEDNIYGEYMNNNSEQQEKDKFDTSKEEKIDKINENDKQDNVTYHEKEYKTNTLEENTVVTKVGVISRFILFGFYLLVIVVGIGAFLMIRANKYEFYLKQDSILIETGSSYQIELIPKNARYFDYLNYDYSIADESIATVDEYGTITSKGTGTTTLKISMRPGFISSKTVKIISEDVDVENVNISVYKDDEYVLADYLELGADQTITIRAIINDREDLNVSATFSSSNPNVAAVDSFGNVTTKSGGTAVITGEVNGIIGEITINVTGSKIPQSVEPARRTTPKPSNNVTPKPNNNITPKPSNEPTPKPTVKPTAKPTASVIQNISLQYGSISIKKGSTVQLTAIIQPESLSSSKLTWKSSDTSVATVDDNGLVKGVGAGKKATISATTSNGLVATCVVTVSNSEVTITKITLNKTTLSLEKGKKAQLTATISPSNATVRKLVWSSDKESVATVDQSGVVTGETKGTATIMVTSSDGKIVAKCTVNVNNPATPLPTAKPTNTPKPAKTSTPKPATTSSSSTGVTKVVLGPAGTITKYVGEEVTIGVTVEPNSVKNYTVTWKSSDTSVAKVTKTDAAHGKVSLIAAGTATITATVDGIEGTVSIIVKPKSTTPTATVRPAATAPAGSQFSGDAGKCFTIDKTSFTINKGSTETFKINLEKYTASGTIYVTTNDKSIISIEYPKSPNPNIPICNETEGLCFMDALTSADEITISVKGLKEGSATINIKTNDVLSASDDSPINGSAKIGILVK